MHKEVMRIILIIFGVLVSGCAATLDVTQESFASDLGGKCFITNETMTVYFADTFPDDTYQLISPKRKKLPIRSSLAPWENGFEIEKGKLIKITKIYDQQYGTSGHCWEVFAKVEGSELPEFLVPSCWVWHQFIWFTPKSPYRLKNAGGKLKVNTELITESKCI
jgi:hypothetical protein